MSKHKHNNMDNKEKLTEEEIKSKTEKTSEEQKINIEDNEECTESNESANDKSDSNSDNEREEKSEEKSPLEVAEAKIEELQDKYLRSVAEFDNFRKRSIKEKAELILNGGERTITAILPVIDDMERAIANADKTDDIDATKEGMKLIYQKFQNILEGMGVKKIETDNKDFDTDFHEAIAMVPGQGDDKKGKILDCVQSGYTLNDKVIRHAKVAVGQ